MADKTATSNVFGLSSIGEVSKLIAFAAPAFTALFATGHFGWNTAIAAALNILGALGILHSSKNPWVKGGIAAGTAAAQALLIYVTNETGFANVSPADWWAVIGAAFGALGATYVPNTTDADPGETPTPDMDADSPVLAN